METFINLGSNIGDRRAIIDRAVALIGAIDGVDNLRRAPEVESLAWGYESANAYINVGIAVDCRLAPLDLLDRLQAIEGMLNTTPHRNADGTYRDRLLDIDLIAMGDTVIDTPRLQLPHPRMHLRPFVLRPIAQLAPEWRHPLSGLTAAEALARLR